MSCRLSLLSRTTVMAKTEYRAFQLGDNGVFFLDHLAFIEKPLLQRFQGVVRCLKQALHTALDRSVVISTENLETLDKLGDVPTYQDNGYSSAAVIDQAINLRSSIRDLKDRHEPEWISFFMLNLREFFQMRSTFASSVTQLWRRYDDAMMQLVPPRADLVWPKPDFAFGLHYDVRTPMYRKLRQWKDKSIPSIDAFVRSGLAMPFLIFESTSNNGSLRTTENQLANSLTKTHDILCSLDLQNDLYVLGIVQLQFIVYLYISFSTRQIDEDGKAYTDTIYVVKIGSCILDEFQGCLRCLKFVEWAKSYGLGEFKDKVEAALNRP